MSVPRLKAVELSGFKSIEQGKAELSDISILIGKNNSGKSNVVEAFLAVQELEEKSNLNGFDSVWESRFTQKDTSNSIEISTIYSFPEERRDQILENIGRHPRRQLKKTKREIEDGEFLNEIKYTATISGMGNRDYAQGFYVDVPDGWLEFNSVQREKNIDINRSKLRDQISESISTWRFANPFRVPEDTDSAVMSTELEPDGENLVRVLNTLESDHPEIFRKISTAYVDIMDGISNVTVEFVRNNKKTIKVEEEGYGIKFSASDISSGSKEILVLLTQIYLAAKDSDVLFLEEPELHLHPEAEQKVFNIIQDLASSEGLQFVISTHSDVFVNRSKAASLTRVVRKGKTELRNIDPEEIDVELKDLGYSKSGLLQAEAVVFVEGISDRLIISEWAKELDLKLDEKGISIVELEGEGNIGTHGRSLVKVLQSFDIPYLFIIDSDDGDPYDVIDEYKKKINREEEEVDEDKIWWYTTPQHFKAWSDSDIEYFLLDAPAAIADVVDEDTDQIISAIGEFDADKNVDVLEHIWDKFASDPHGVTSYEKELHGRMIARKMDQDMMHEEIIEAINEMRELV